MWEGGSGYCTAEISGIPQRVVDIVYMVRDQMLEEDREICSGLSITIDPLIPFIEVPRENLEVAQVLHRGSFLIDFYLFL